MELRRYSEIDTDEDDGVMSLSECSSYDDDSIFPSSYSCDTKDDVAWCDRKE